MTLQPGEPEGTGTAKSKKLKMDSEQDGLVIQADLDSLSRSKSIFKG
jgi:hypothetical protein